MPAKPVQETSADQGAIVFRPIREQDAIDDNIPNVLHTIMEETAATNVFESEALVTSTPFLREESIQEESEIDSTGPALQNQSIASPSPARSASRRNSSSDSSQNTSVKRRTRSPEPARPVRQRVIVDTSSEDELDAPSPMRLPSVSRRQNIAANLTQDEESLGEQTEETLRPSNDTSVDGTLQESKEQTLEKSTEMIAEEFSLSDLSKIPLKECSINFVKCPSTPTTISNFTKTFIKNPPVTEENEASETENSQENKAPEESSDDDDDLESVTSVATSASYASISSNATSKSSYKRKAAEVPRRSTGRPKRKARMLVTSFSEPSINRKMRRSRRYSFLVYLLLHLFSAEIKQKNSVEIYFLKLKLEFSER
jgi:hypothetical protein